MAAFLRELAGILELKGDSIFKIRAYRAAAERIEELPEPVSTIVQEGRIRALPGVGEAIADKVTEFVITGRSSRLERYRAELPDGLEALAHLPGVTPAAARQIYRRLGATSLADVKQAARQRRLREMVRLPDGVEETLAEGPGDSRAQPGAPTEE